MVRDHIPEELTGLANRLPTWLLDLDLLQHIHANRIGIHQMTSNYLMSVALVERHMGGIERARSMVKLCRTADDWRTLQDRLFLQGKRPQAPVRRVPFPPAPFKGTEKLIPLDSRTKVRREGKRMRNCTFMYMDEVLNEQAYVFHWSGGSAQEEATVLLQREDEYPCRWNLSQVKCLKNADPQPRTLSAIVETLTNGMGDRVVVSSVNGKCLRRRFMPL